MSMLAYRNGFNQSFCLIALLDYYSQQSMSMTDVQTKIETFGYLRAIFQNITQNNRQLSENEMVNRCAEAVGKVDRALQNLLGHVKSKMKMITSTTEMHDRVEEIKEFLEKMYVEEEVNSNVQRYISGFVNLLRLRPLGEEFRVTSYIQQSPLKRYFSEIRELNKKAIDKVLGEVEKKERVLYHIKIKALIEMKLEDIFNHNYDTLKAIVQGWKSEKQIEHAKILHSIIQKEFRDLTFAVFNIIDAKFRVFSVSENVDNRSKELKECLQQNQQKLPLIKQKILIFYQKCKKTLIYDIRNNMSKTFSMQFAKNDQLRYKVALLQIQKFDFKFSFTNNLLIYIKDYHSWYRGKFQEENKIMYLKHWNIINYLILTVPHGVVQYFDASEDKAGQTMKFIMEKGQRCFTNFQQGYAYFTSLKVEGKVRLILDLAESLIILEEHGINHNDITIRNTVPIKGAFKLIDFDVARMFDVDFDASSYSQSNRQLIKEYRSQIIRLTKVLMKMQLKQQRIISKSDPKQASVQVENINRLSEYFFLPNENPILKRLKSNLSYHSSFSREQRLNLIVEYESYIVGKRDCNKFGLMMLKLMYQGRQKEFTQFLNSKVDEFIKGINRRPFSVDYNKMLTYFKLDQSLDDDTNVQILKLMTLLFEPEMHKRIPMKLFYFKLLSILRISKYRTIVRPFKPKEALPRQINPESLNLQMFMVSDIGNQRRQLLQQIQQVFKNTINYAKQHYQEYARISQTIFSSLSDPANIQLTTNSVKNRILSSRSIMIISKIADKINKLVEFAWEALKKMEVMVCSKHGLRIQAECEEPHCKQRWLCSQCLYDLLFCPPISKQLQHVKKIVSAGKTKNNYHHIAYIGTSRRHRVQVVCLLVQGKTYNFKCLNCLAQTSDLSKYDCIYFIDWNKRIFYDVEDATDTKSLTTSYLPSRLNIMKYNAIFGNLTEIQEMKVLQNASIRENFRMGSSVVEQRFKELGRTQAFISEMIESNSKISKIVELLQYMKTQPTLLKELRRHQKDLDSYFHNLKLNHIAKLINGNKGINLLDYCEYFIDRIRETFDEIYEQTNKLYEVGKENRERHVISNRRLFQPDQFIPLIRDMFKEMQGEKTVSRLYPTGQTLMMRYHVKNVQTNKQPEPKQNQNSKISNIANIYGDQSNCKSDYDNEVCPCKKEITMSPQQIQIKYFCTAEECSCRFFCRTCEESHDKDHLLDRIEFCERKEDSQQIEFLLRKIENLKRSLKINKLLEKIIAEIGVEMIEPIDFINSMYESSDQTEKLKEVVFERLKKLIIDGKVKEYGDYLWIIKHYLSNPQQFMKIFKLQAERYISCIIQTKTGFEALYARLKESPINSIKKSREGREEPYFAPCNKNESERLFDQSYRTIMESITENASMPLEFITNRHRKRVQNILILGIKESITFQSSLKQQQRNQFKKKLAYNHYNNFDISLYWDNFKSSHSVFLSHLQKFENLKRLTIIDEPNWANPIAFKSMQIQQMLIRINCLQKLKLHCLNGFDRYCLEIIQHRHHQCQVDIYSFLERVVEWKWMNRLFQKEPYLDLPFSIDGELMSPFSSDQIVSGQYYLSLTDSTIKQTMNRLAQFKKIPASHLKLIFNHLLELERLHDPFSFFDVKVNFWCRITFGTYLTIKLQEQINRRCMAIKFIFPSLNKFTELKSLTLNGLIVNGGNDNFYAQSVQSSLNQYLSSLKLETLQFVKCFGLKMSVIFQNIYTLKRLIIEQCAFKEENMESYPYFVQLQTLIMKRVGLFQVDSKNRLLSREMASILGRFNITTLSLLILNDFYELDNKQLEWIQKCPIKKLSLRRCFKITSDIYMLTMRIKQLQEFDITDTDIQESAFRHKNTGEGKERLRLFNSLRKIAVEKIEKNSNIKVMKELSRMASYYHIEHMQKAVNTDVFQPLPLSLIEIKEARLENLKIREKGQYYLMEMLGKLPDLQILSIINCEWKSRTKIESIRYGQFTYIKELEKLKELSLVNANIRKLSSTRINAYKYLRKLVLSHNPYLDEVSDLQFGELKELDVSNTGVTIINLNFTKLPTILCINLQNTKIKMFPEEFLLSKTIRIIFTSLKPNHVEGTTTNFRKYVNSDAPLKPIITLQKIMASQILDRQLKKLQDIIEKIEIIEDKMEQKNKQLLKKYLNSCIVIDSKETIQKIQWVSYKTLLRFELFKVEMDVKGILNYERMSRFYEQQKQREQWKVHSVRQAQWKEDAQYQLMTLESKIQQKVQVYKTFFVKNYLLGQNAIHALLFQNKYRMVKYASEKQNDDYMVAYHPPIREFEDMPYSNFITKRSAQYQACSEYMIVPDYLDAFLDFLWQCNADMDRRNIMNYGITIKSIGLSKDRQRGLFKIIDPSDCMLVEANKDSPLYKIIYHLFIRRKSNRIDKQALNILRKTMNPKEANSEDSYLKEKQAIIMENLRKIDWINLGQKLQLADKHILNKQQPQELHQHIESIFEVMQKYKKFVNCRQVMDILKDLRKPLAQKKMELTVRTLMQEKLKTFQGQIKDYLNLA